MRDIRKRAARIAPILIILVAAGCRALAGVDDLTFDDGSPGPAGPAASSSTGGVEVCEPGEMRACYSGPAGSEGVEICKGGTEACLEDGKGFGPCTGEVTPAPADDCKTPVDETCGTGAPSCGALLWAKTFGSTGNDEGADVAVGMSPGSPVALTGLCGGAITLGMVPTSCSQNDLFIASFDAAGGPLWDRTAGDSYDQEGLGVAVTPMDDVLAVGRFEGEIDLGGDGLWSAAATFDAYLARYSPGGLHAYSNDLGDAQTNQVASAVTSDAQGDMLVFGTFGGTISFGAGQLTASGDSALFVAKVGKTGVASWADSYNGNGAQVASGIAVDSSGNVLLAGYMTGTLDFGPNLLSSGGYDIFAVKLDPQGDTLWAHRFGNNDHQRGTGVAADPQGNVLLCGSFVNKVDFGSVTLTSNGENEGYVVKLSPDGTSLWGVGVGGSSYDSVNEVATDGAGNVFITGSVNGLANVGDVVLEGPAVEPSAFVAKLDGATGSVIWARLLNSTSAPSAGRSLTLGSAGEVYVTGYFTGDVDFGAGPMMGVGGTDIFLVKLAP